MPAAHKEYDLIFAGGENQGRRNALMTPPSSFSFAYSKSLSLIYPSRLAIDAM